MIARKRTKDGEEIPAGTYAEIPWLNWCRNASNSICENCQNAVGGCSWSKSFEPVDGWVALELDADVQVSSDPVKTYKIYFCPEFVLDAENDPMGMERQHNVLAELLYTIYRDLGRFNTEKNRLYKERTELKELLSKYEKEIIDISTKHKEAVDELEKCRNAIRAAAEDILPD